MTPEERTALQADRDAVVTACIALTRPMDGGSSETHARRLRALVAMSKLVLSLSRDIEGINRGKE